MSGYGPAWAAKILAERDTARADLAALRQRVETLCDKSTSDDERLLWGMIRARDLRAALAGTATQPGDGYCVCDDGKPWLDCGIFAHRQRAFELRNGLAGPAPAEATDEELCVECGTPAKHHGPMAGSAPAEEPND